MKNQEEVQNQEGVQRCISELSDAELLSNTRALIGHSNQVFAALLVHLGEVEARGLHRTRGCSSLYAYCVYDIRLSEDAAVRRVTAARLVRQFPALLEAIAAGELHLTGLLMLGPHLTRDNHLEVLASAKHRTKKEIATLVRVLDPLPEVPPKIEVLGPAPVRPGAASDLGQPRRVAVPGPRARSGLPAPRRTTRSIRAGTDNRASPLRGPVYGDGRVRRAHRTGAGLALASRRAGVDRPDPARSDARLRHGARKEALRCGRPPQSRARTDARAGAHTRAGADARAQPPPAFPSHPGPRSPRRLRSGRGALHVCRSDRASLRRDALPRAPSHRAVCARRATLRNEPHTALRGAQRSRRRARLWAGVRRKKARHAPTAAVLTALPRPMLRSGREIGRPEPGPSPTARQRPTPPPSAVPLPSSNFGPSPAAALMRGSERRWRPPPAAPPPALATGGGTGRASYP
jgi:hypothetical protein